MCRIRLKRKNRSNELNDSDKLLSQSSSTSFEQSRKRSTGGEIRDDTEIRKELAHYALTVPFIYGHRLRNIMMWKLPVELSQSKLAGRTKLSSACTLIALKVAEYIYRKRLLFTSLSDDSKIDSQRNVNTICPPAIVNALLNSILDGNQIYERTVPEYNSKEHLFNIPEALKATNEQFHEIQFCAMTGRIDENLAVNLRAALESSLLQGFKQLFFLVIIFERTILLVVQRYDNLISAIDSHRHHNMGSYIMSGRLDELEIFTKLLTDKFFPETHSLPDVLQSFEMSVIHFIGHLYSSDYPLDPIREPIVWKRNNRVFPRVPSHKRINHEHVSEALEALRQGNLPKLELLLQKVRMHAGKNTY